MTAPVVREQRFYRLRPCPVCGGYDGQARGKATRCFGFLSADRRYAHCTREGLAGNLLLNPESGAYAHRLDGPCDCGATHGKSAPRPFANGSGTPRRLTAADFRNATAVYDYADETGTTLFRIARIGYGKGKEFKAYHPDGPGCWLYGATGIRCVPYRLPELRAGIERGETVYVVEGEKKVDMLRELGLTATTNPFGAGKWKPEHTAAVGGAARVVVIADNDVKGRTHADEVARSIHDAGAPDVRCIVPTVEEAQGIDDWLASRNSATGDQVRAELEGLLSGAPPWKPDSAPRPGPEPTKAESTSADTRLLAVRETFARWLYLPDDTPLLALLGAVAANRLPGDPVWLLLVAPPGSGKTELLESQRSLPDVHAAATLNEAALLSGTPKKEHASGAKGGLLREIGERGIILCKDFGSVLSMHHDARSQVLAALREVYDGNWTRHVGTSGGLKLSWSGRVGIVAGCPPTIDRHHAVMSSLGERFLMLRFGAATSEAQTRKALSHAGKERTMRKELAAAVVTLFAEPLPDAQPALTEDELTQLIRLATLVSQCRSSVERDGYTRDVELIPGPESPTRLAVTLRRLFDGLAAIGVGRKRAWAVVRRVALDSMPAIRASVLRAVRGRGEVDTTAVGTAIGYPTNTARRALEDLAAYNVLKRLPQSKGLADKWRVAESFAPYLYTLPEKSVDLGMVPEKSGTASGALRLHNTEHVYDDFSGKVPPGE